MKGIAFINSVRDVLPDMTLGSAIRHTQMMRGKSAGLVRIVPRKYPGLTLEIRAKGTDRWTFREVFVKNVYAEAVKAVPNVRRILDLGANVGLASLYFSWWFPGSEVIAVEANPESFGLLQRNLSRLQPAGRARAIHAAVWSEDGFVEGMDAGQPELYSRYKVGAGAATGSAPRIPARRMETIFQDAGWDEVDFIKVDIEGAEIELFRDGADWLKRTRCVAIEFHDDSRRLCDWPAILARHGMREVAGVGSHTAIGVRD